MAPGLRHLTSATAADLIASTRARAEAAGLAVSTAVLDEGGHLLAFDRMDGALLVSAEIAQNKAYTARMFHGPTHGMAAQMQPGSPIYGLAARRLLPLGGGMPLEQDGRIVGAVGVAGASEEADAALAQAAADIFADTTTRSGALALATTRRQIMGKLEGKVAIITGATSGIGQQTAVDFAAEGAKVVVAGRRRQEGEAIVHEISEAGGEATFIQTDVTDEQQVADLVRQTVERYGKLDVAFNNAGTVSAFGALPDQTREAWQAEIDVNLSSVFYSMKHEIPAMLGNGGGSIINNASQLGAVGIGGGAGPYVAAKHGVVGLTRAAALEQAQSGVRVNAILPAGVDTPLFRSTMGATAEGAAQIASLHPVNRVSQPSEISPLVVYLASDQASFVTGSALAIDGGWTAQ